MKLKEKTKRNLLIAGAVVLSIGLIVGISGRFVKDPVKEPAYVEVRETGTEIEVPSADAGEADSENMKENNTEQETVEGETGRAETVKEEEVSEENQLIIETKMAERDPEEKAVLSDSRLAQTDQKEQSIQPEPTKPETPNEEVLKDPTTKPDGTRVEGAPVAVDHDHVERPEELPQDSDAPQAGDTKGGEIYIPGFGWVENHGGGGSGTVASDMYENGNKIGSMD